MDIQFQKTSSSFQNSFPSLQHIFCFKSLVWMCLILILVLLCTHISYLICRHAGFYTPAFCQRPILLPPLRACAINAYSSMQYIIQLAYWSPIPLLQIMPRTCKVLHQHITDSCYQACKLDAVSTLLVVLAVTSCNVIILVRTLFFDPLSSFYQAQAEIKFAKHQVRLQ